jgi:ABC-2 type transport system permease protein/sodium transport system permease protein
LLQAAVSVVVFVACPALFALAQRVGWRDGFRWRAATWRAIPGAACLGIALWPFAYELFLVGKMLGLATLDRDRFAEIERLIRDVGDVSPVVVLLALALVQPVCEELFFRGFLFQGLRERFEGTGVIAASSLLFALFHVLNPATLTPERFLPSLLLGLFLGWVCYRSGSVLPGIVLHVLHNGLLLLLVQYRDAIIARGWNLADRTHLPAAWFLVAGALVAGGMLLVLVATRRPVATERAGTDPGHAT